MHKIFSIVLIFLIFTSLIAGCTKTTTSTSKREIANELSAKIKSIGKIDSSIVDDYNKFQDTIGKINTIIRVINEKIGTKLEEIGTSSSDFEKFKRLMRYSPLIGSYDDLYESSCRLPSTIDSDYDRFYIDLTKFSLDYGMLNAQLSYHISYRATGEIATRLGLERLAPYIGYEAYGALLSGIHWTFRGEFDNLTENTFNFVENQITNSTI